MTRKYCDICETEIMPDSQFGMFIKFAKVAVFDPKTQTAKMDVQEEHIELCEKCVKQITEKIKKMKK